MVEYMNDELERIWKHAVVYPYLSCKYGGKWRKMSVRITSILADSNTGPRNESRALLLRQSPRWLSDPERMRLIRFYKNSGVRFYSHLLKQHSTLQISHKRLVSYVICRMNGCASLQVCLSVCTLHLRNDRMNFCQNSLLINLQTGSIPSTHSTWISLRKTKEYK